MSLRTFTSIPLIVDTLDTIYTKGACHNGLLAYYRGDLIRNASLKLYWDQTQDAF